MPINRVGAVSVFVQDRAKEFHTHLLGSQGNGLILVEQPEVN